MCAGAILNSRVRRVVYGAADAKAGCCGSVTDLFAMPFNHHPVVESGLRAEEAQALLQAFFKDLREYGIVIAQYNAHECSSLLCSELTIP